MFVTSRDNTKQKNRKLSRKWSSNLSSFKNEIEGLKKEKFTSKTKNCVSSFTAISGIGTIEQDSKGICGDQEHRTIALQNVTNELPNSRGDYCKTMPNKPDNDTKSNQHNALKTKLSFTNEIKPQYNENSIPVEEQTKLETIKDVKIKNNIDELSIKHCEFQKNIEAVETLKQILETGKPEVYQLEPKKNSSYNLPKILDVDKADDGLKKVDDKIGNETTKDFPEKINKIINNVESLYAQLEDIHSKENYEFVPTFNDNTEVIDIPSEEFLTPFMKNLKNKRNNNAVPQKEDNEETTSYTKVINFLNDLNETQNNVAKEVQFARLCFFSKVIHFTIVLHVGKQEHTTIITVPDKPSCLRKLYESKIKKKVSFSTEEKGNQVKICSHNRDKQLRTLSHQFPPLENPQQEFEYLDHSEVGNYHNNDNKSTSHFLQNDSICIQETTHIILKDNYTQKSITTDEEYIPCNSDIDNLEVKNPNVDIGNNLVNSLTDVLNDNSEVSETRSENLSQRKSSEPYILDEPQIKVYYDEFNKNIPQVIVKNVLHPNNKNESNEGSKNISKKLNQKPNIFLFRELTNTAEMLKPFSDIKNRISNSSEETLQKRTNDFEIHKKIGGNSEDEKTVTLLRSLYAVVYILMFTALNLQYTCVYS